MRCSKAREFISDALDERLDERSGLQLSRHLDGCGDCRRHQQVLTDGRALLRQEVVEPSENFDWKVQLKIQQALREKAARPEPLSGWQFWRPALASAAGVAAVVLVAGGLMLGRSGPDPQRVFPADRGGAGFRVAESVPASEPVARPDLSGGVRRQPLRINTVNNGFGIRTVADEGFVNRSPFPDPFEGTTRWLQEGEDQLLEVRRKVGPDGEVYFTVRRMVPHAGGVLNLEVRRSTVHGYGSMTPVTDRPEDPDS